MLGLRRMSVRLTPMRAFSVGSLSFVVASVLLIGSASGQGLASLFDFSNPVANIDPRPEATTVPLAYQANLSCSIRFRAYRKGKKVAESTFTISTKRVKSRILIAHQRAEGNSTMLISESGDLIDYNVPSQNGSRTSPDSGDTNAFWTHTPTGLHPRFSRSGQTPDRFGGDILGPDKRLFARLLYQGKVTFNNGKLSFGVRPALVFDIMSPERSSQMPNGMPMGRIVIDEEDGLLQALVIGFNERLQYQRQSCTKSPGA